ncbi:MAG: cytochrome c maturation protein CcmE [Pseudomonadota bacterium]
MLDLQRKHVHYTKDINKTQVTVNGTIFSACIYLHYSISCDSSGAVSISLFKAKIVHPKTKSRLFLALIITASVSFGVALLLSSMRDSIVFFYTPSELPSTLTNKDIRIGGLVKPGSITQIDQSAISFIVTDSKADIFVQYRGVIPVLFRENQGAVVAGRLENGIFIAKELLTKHDENYRPPGMKGLDAALNP